MALVLTPGKGSRRYFLWLFVWPFICLDTKPLHQENRGFLPPIFNWCT